MSMQRSTIIDVRTPPKTGYYAARESDLVRSIPVVCAQFLTTRLEPAEWFRLHAIDSCSDSMISEFGQAMGRMLKSSADHAWLNDDPPKGHIDLIPPSAYGFIETLIYVRAMDIASGFLRIKSRSYYPNFERQLRFDSRDRGISGPENFSERRSKSPLQFLGRLDNLSGKLENIKTSMRPYEMYSTLTPPEPLPQGATVRDQDIQRVLHADVSLLARNWAHESEKSWMKVLCVLEGVAFHIRVLRYHGGAEQRASWKRIIKDRFLDNLGINNADEAIEKLNKDLPRWKQAFANAISISPLVLITGKGFGQMLNMATALRVGGRLVSHGKPELILHVEELLWRCIIGIAWGSWTSDVGLSNFLTSIEPMMKEWKKLKAQSQGLANDGERQRRWLVYQREDSWFQETVTYMLKNHVRGLGARLRGENKEWLEAGKAHWLHWLVKTGYEASPTTERPRYRTRGRSCSPRRDSKLRRPARRRSLSIPPTMLSPPVRVAGLAEPAFPRESVPKICCLLTYHVEKWGYDNYPGTWPNEPVMPLLTRVQDIDLTSMTIRGVLPWRKCTQAQNTNGDSRETTRVRKLEDTLSSGRKRKRADSLAEEDEAMGSATVSKRARGDPGVSRSQIVVHFPSVLVHRTGGGPADLRWFSLLSDQEKDNQTIDGWNKCVISGRRRSATKSSMILMQEFSFIKENPAKILEMFGSYNILLFGKETSPMLWSLAALREIGPLDVLRKVQDHQSHSMTTTTVYMSLREIFEDGLKNEGRVLNTFSLPSLCNKFGDDPLHSILASHVPAFEGTVDLLPEEMFNPQYPCGAISFWMVSMKGAISYIHSNSAGVGTVVEVVCGRQLWYIFRRSESTVNDSCIDEYLGDWAPGFIPDSKKWEAELVVLEPGMAFCMRPDTHYAVVTLENTIAKGHRFYAMSALQKSVSGWVHTSMLGYTITDDLHLEFQEVLLRMMCYFSTIICNGHVELESHDIHVPSISTRDGLLNLIALGNLCVFSSALNRCVRERGSNDKGKPAIAAAIAAYSSIIEYANKRYRLVLLRAGVQDVEKADHLGNIQMDAVSITDFAHSSAAYFAQSLIAYAPRALERRKALGQQESAMFDFKAFEQDIKDAMIDFMNKDFTDKFIKAYESQRRKMMHLKPKFLVKEISVDLGNNILDEWRGITDYSPSDDEDKEREGEGDHEDEEGNEGGRVEVERDEDM